MSFVYYYNSNTGNIAENENWIPFPELHLGIGWHGPFNSKDEITAYYQANKDANPGWKEPNHIANQFTGSLKDAAGAAVGGGVTDSIGNFNVGGWFIRIGEILVGIVLLGVGIAKLTGASNAVSNIVKARI
jgi:hypothetical protein